MQISLDFFDGEDDVDGGLEGSFLFLLGLNGVDLGGVVIVNKLIQVGTCSFDSRISRHHERIFWNKMNK